MLRTVDSTSSKSGDFVLPLPGVQPSTPAPELAAQFFDIPQGLMQEFWLTAEAEICGLGRHEFGAVLMSVAAKVNYGLPSGVVPDATQKAAFFRSLHLSELALAHGCALGREAAWARFLKLYRASLTQAAIAISGSATLGYELADSLYAELYGLREVNGERRSPLASYSGRGSLLGWLRATLAQRHINHHRQSHREAPLEDVDAPAPMPVPPSAPAELARLSDAVARSLTNLHPEDRYLLSSYFLDRQTILQIGQILGVHESTISRRLKRLAADLRKQLLVQLQASGLSKRAAEEALGTDPRDIEINMRTLLQTSQIGAFSDKKAAGEMAPASAAASDSL
jgi:RNA polymerase sigma-70 factor (ECF subfamily)